MRYYWIDQFCYNSIKVIEILKKMYTCMCILYVTDKIIDLIQWELQIYFIDVIRTLYYTISESNGLQRIFKSDVIYVYCTC